MKDEKIRYILGSSFSAAFIYCIFIALGFKGAVLITVYELDFILMLAIVLLIVFGFLGHFERDKYVLKAVYFTVLALSIFYCYIFLDPNTLWNNFIQWLFSSSTGGISR